MKIKLCIINELEEWLHEDNREFIDGEWKTVKILRIEPYDYEKCKTGRIYEFDSLEAIEEFVETCSFKYTEKYSNIFNTDYHWSEIEIKYEINKEKHNFIELHIFENEYFRD